MPDDREQELDEPDFYIEMAKKYLQKILQNGTLFCSIFFGLIILNFFLFGIPEYRKFIERVKHEISYSLYEFVCLNIALNDLLRPKLPVSSLITPNPFRTVIS